MFSATLLLIVAGPTSAQQTPRAARPPAIGPQPVRSPEVSPDGEVTFRLRAPNDVPGPKPMLRENGADKMGADSTSRIGTDQDIRVEEDPHAPMRQTSSSVRMPRASAKGRRARRDRSNRRMAI